MANQLKLWSGEIHQGNPEVLDISNCPETQQLDWFLKLAWDHAYDRTTFDSYTRVQEVKNSS